MLLREEEEFLSHEINIISNVAGLGDHICRAPAIKHLLNTYPHVTVHLYIHDFVLDLYSYWFKGRINIFFYPIQSFKQAPKRPSYWFHDNFTTSLGSHLVDTAFLTILNQTPLDPKFRSYLPITGYSNNLFIRDYVVLTPGFTSKTRSLPGQVWNNIASHINYMGYDVVWLGKKEFTNGMVGKFDDSIDFSFGFDLRDKTDLFEAARIMDRSRLVIGLDNGLIHLAGCTNAPILVGYSSVTPALRLPIRHGILGFNCTYIEPNGCRGCESKMRFCFNKDLTDSHDFRTCYFDDYACIKELDSLKWINAIEGALNAKQ